MAFLKALILRLFRKYGKDILMDLVQWILAQLSEEDRHVVAAKATQPMAAATAEEVVLSPKESAICDAAVACCDPQA